MEYMVLNVGENMKNDCRQLTTHTKAAGSISFDELFNNISTDHLISSTGRTDCIFQFSGWIQHVGIDFDLRNEATRGKIGRSSRPMILRPSWDWMSRKLDKQTTYKVWDIFSKTQLFLNQSSLFLSILICLPVKILICQFFNLIYFQQMAIKDILRTTLPQIG